MKKDQSPSKGKKALQWMKEKKLYIMLLCCIMVMGAAYYFISAGQNSPKSVQAPKADVDYVAQGTAAPASVPTAIPTIKPPKATAVPKTTIPKSAPAENAAAGTDVQQPAAPAAMQIDEPVPTVPPREKLTYPVSGEVICEFTGETLIYSKTLGDWRAHSGIDLKVDLGSPVKAAGDGIIEDVYSDDAMGITIVIDHQNGIKSVYQNLSTDTMVEKGQTVTAGLVISGIGDTALFETGEVGHLHFEIIIDGENVNPLDWLTA